MQFKGGRELAAKLKRMDRDVRTKELDRAGRAGSTIIRNEAKLLAPVESGLLRDAIISRKQRKLSTTYSSAYAVGVGSKAWYFPLVEFGTQPHTIRARRSKVLASNAVTSIATGQTRKAGYFGTVVHHPGTSANPFFRRAWEGKKRSAVIVFRDTLRRRILRG